VISELLGEILTPSSIDWQGRHWPESVFRSDRASNGGVYASTSRQSYRSRSQVVPSAAEPTYRWNASPSDGPPRTIRQRHFCSMRRRVISRRHLAAAVFTRLGIGSAGQEGRITTATFRAGKAVRPSTIHQQADATLLVGEPCLKFDAGHLLRHRCKRTWPLSRHQAASWAIGISHKLMGSRALPRFVS
jgi:hypothetical protein